MSGPDNSDRPRARPAPRLSAQGDAGAANDRPQALAVWDALGYRIRTAFSRLINAHPPATVLFMFAGIVAGLGIAISTYPAPTSVEGDPANLYVVAGGLAVLGCLVVVYRVLTAGRREDRRIREQAGWLLLDLQEDLECGAEYEARTARPPDDWRSSFN